jgi:hypothetical protein
MTDDKYSRLPPGIRWALGVLEPYLPLMREKVKLMTGDEGKRPVLIVGTDQMLVRHLMPILPENVLPKDEPHDPK